MSLTDIKTKNQGFTIVELLIVVVVIAILAAITIVSYNGITNRANASAAASMASAIQKKAELFAADGPTSMYPKALADLTGSAAIVGASPAKTTSSSDTWYVSPSSATLGTPSAANGKTTVSISVCGHNGTTTAPTTLAGISTVTGITISYFNYEAGSGTNPVNVGITGTSTGTNARACYAATS